MNAFEHLLVSLGGKPTYANVTWDTVEIDGYNEKAIKTLRNSYCTGVPPGVFLWGPAGSGKTYLMKAAFNYLVKWKLEMISENRNSANTGVYWIRLGAYLESLRERDESIKNRAMKAKWLFIDDLGTGTTTEWVIDQVTQLIEERHEAELQTFITSNFSLEELSKLYHERVCSRIAAMCILVPIKGPDRRIGKQKKYNQR